MGRWRNYKSSNKNSSESWWTDYGKNIPFRFHMNSSHFKWETTYDHDHLHYYGDNLDDRGNGWTEWSVHMSCLTGRESECNIRHRHKVLDWKILTSESTCYPDCNSDPYNYGVGVGPHIHNIKKRIKGKS